MIMVVSIILLLFLLVLYAISSYYSDKLSFLRIIDAGPVVNHGKSNTNVKIKPLTSQDCIYTKERKRVNLSNFQQFAVVGECMRGRKIEEGNIVLVERFDNKKDKKDLIKPQDILVIYLNDKKYKGYKIREFKGFDEDGTLITFWYEEDNTKHRSSVNHQINQVAGVVKHVINPQNGFTTK